MKRIVAVGAIIGLLINPDLINADKIVEPIDVGKGVDNKITDLLSNKMEECSGKIPVGIWLKEADKEYFWELAQDKEKMELTSLEKEEAEINLKYGINESVGEISESYFNEMEAISSKIDKIIASEREIYEEYNENKEKGFLNKYDIEDTIFVSRYAPYIVCEIDKEKIYDIIKDDNVIEINYSNWGDCLETEQNYDFSEYLSQNATSINTSYKQSIGIDLVQSQGYTGVGVSVGLVDSIQINPTSHSEFGGSNITPVGGTLSAGSVSDHAINMGRIICGDYGVAKLAHVYSYGCGGLSAFVDYANGFEQVIANGANVINFSVGVIDRDQLGYYTDLEKWMDHISYQHNITVVTVAGNTSFIMTDPAVAFNVITVANYNHISGNIDSTSAYNYGGSSYCAKPDISAPGANVLMYYGTGNGGTSSSAACTTGVIALLMQAKPSLKTMPHAVKAILLASCELIGTSTSPSGYLSGQGAGLVNAYKALRIIQLNQYSSSSTSTNGTINITRTVAAGRNSTNVSLAILKRNTITSSSHSYGSPVNVIVVPNISLLAKNASGNSICGSNMPCSSTEILRCSYQSTLIICVMLSNIVQGPIPWSVAWY